MHKRDTFTIDFVFLDGLKSILYAKCDDFLHSQHVAHSHVRRDGKKKKKSNALNRLKYVSKP